MGWGLHPRLQAGAGEGVQWWQGCMTVLLQHGQGGHMQLLQWNHQRMLLGWSRWPAMDLLGGCRRGAVRQSGAGCWIRRVQLLGLPASRGSYGTWLVQQLLCADVVLITLHRDKLRAAACQAVTPWRAHTSWGEQLVTWCWETSACQVLGAVQCELWHSPGGVHLSSGSSTCRSSSGSSTRSNSACSS